MSQELEYAVNHMQDLTDISLFVQLVLGIVTGTLTGLTGASGTSVLISVLLTLKVPAQQIIASTFAIAGVNATFAILPFLSRYRPTAREIGAMAVPASIGGIASFLFLARDAGDDFLGLSLTGLMLVAGLYLMAGVKKQDKQLLPIPDSLVSVLSFLAGGMIGLFGGGGAIFITLILVIFLGIPYHRALMLSLLVTIFTCVPLLGLSYFEGNLLIRPVLVILASSIPCAIYAATWANKVPEKTIKRLLGFYLVCISFFLFGSRI